MALSILNNIPSLEAQNQLAMTNMKLQNVLFQLSSGSKINSGADDPAGLSIADGLQANISALAQSAQNVSDGVGMLQTADGALSQVTTLLNRAVTLATQAANSGLTQGVGGQQAALQNEFQSITNEINQIGSNTTYNNNAVFTGGNMSVFLSDGSAADSADPNIYVAMPNLSASSLGLSSYATGTLDLTSNPTAGNTVQIGTQTYKFVAAGQANAAGDVALGNSVQTTLQNLQAAVNGAPGAGNIYGNGTTPNTLATIISVNGGSAVVQALNAGSSGNSVALTTNLTSTVGAAGGGTAISGGTNATSSTGTLTLNAQPGIVSTATATLTMTAVPDTLTSATGVLNLTAAQPTAAINASGTLNLTSAQPVAGNSTGTLTLIDVVTTGDTATIGDQTYTFVTAGTAANAGEVSMGASFQDTMDNLMAAVNGTGVAGAGTYIATASPNGTARILSDAGGVAQVQSLAADAGNTMALSASLTGGGATGTASAVAGGAAADTVTIGAKVYTFVASGLATAGNEIALGADQNATLQNLQAALSGGTGSGTTFYTSGANNGANGAVTISISGGGTGNVATLTATTAGVGGGSTGNNTAFSASGSIASGVTAISGGVNGDTVTVGGQTYSFVVSGEALQANYVALGADQNGTLNNLAAAVNGSGAGSSSTFGVGTAAAGNASMYVAPSATTATFTAIAPGTAGNSVALNATGSIATDVGPTGLLSGGAAADTVTVGNQTYTFVAAGQALSANEVSVGATVAATLANLKAAVNGIGTGSNTTYGVGTTSAATYATIGAILNGVATVTAATPGAGAAGAGGTGTGMNVQLATNSSTNTFAASAPSGGAAADTVTIGNVTYTFVAAGTATTGNTVALGTGGTAAQNLAQTLTNLKSAVNATVTGAGANGAYNVATLNTGASMDINPQNADQAILTALTSGVNTTTVLTGAFAGGANTGAVSGSGDLAGGTAASAASGNLLLNSNPMNGNTVTIGGTTYKFVSSSPTAANEVLINAGSINGTLNNLKDAVDQQAGVAGVNYGVGTVANSAVGITVNGNQATVTAAATGSAGNSITLSANLSNGVGGGTVGTVGSNLSGGGASVDLSAPTNAQAALTTIAAAIAKVASERGAIGAGINQMNAALTVMTNTSQNLTSSLSGIKDANIGKVVADMSKYQVLEQTGIAALAQANSQEQAILKLLQ